MAENNGVVLCKNKGEFSGLKATFLNANVNVKYTTANHFQGRIQEFLIEVVQRTVEFFFWEGGGE